MCPSDTDSRRPYTDTDEYPPADAERRRVHRFPLSSPRRVALGALALAGLLGGSTTGAGQEQDNGGETPDEPDEDEAAEPEETPDEPEEDDSDEPEETPEEPVDEADEPEETPDEPEEDETAEPEETPDEPVDDGEQAALATRLEELERELAATREELADTRAELEATVGSGFNEPSRDLIEAIGDGLFLSNATPDLWERWSDPEQASDFLVAVGDGVFVHNAAPDLTEARERWTDPDSPFVQALSDGIALDFPEGALDELVDPANDHLTAIQDGIAEVGVTERFVATVGDGIFVLNAAPDLRDHWARWTDPEAASTFLSAVGEGILLDFPEGIEESFREGQPRAFLTATQDGVAAVGVTEPFVEALVEAGFESTRR